MNNEECITIKLADYRKFVDSAMNWANELCFFDECLSADGDGAGEFLFEMLDRAAIDMMSEDRPEWESIRSVTGTF